MMDDPKAPKFEGVARMIAGTAPPPPFLAVVLAEMAGGITASHREEQTVPSAPNMRGRLTQAAEAAEILVRLLHDTHVVGRLDRVSVQPGIAPKPIDTSAGKLDWLREIAQRSQVARADVKANGVEAWPMPEGMMATQLCALIIARFWRAVRGMPPNVKEQRYVRRACSAMWIACGLEPTGEKDGRWNRPLEMAHQLLDDPNLAAGESPNSPEGKLYQHAVTSCNAAAERITGYAKKQADRERVAKVQERIALERAAQAETKH